MPRTGTLVFALWLAGALPSFSRADEVDEILALKERAFGHVQRMSAEYTVESTQPSSMKNPKTVRMRYKVRMERLPASDIRHAHQPWRIETEVLEPIPMNMKIEGEQAWFKDQRGQWVELPMTPEFREQFLGMSERYMGADPVEKRKHFAIKVTRHNNPIFGPRTRTLEFVPKGKANLFMRMEEDIDNNGLPINTRVFDASNRETVRVSVKRHHKSDGVPVVDEMESVSQTPLGEVKSRSICNASILETGGDGR